MSVNGEMMRLPGQAGDHRSRLLPTNGGIAGGAGAEVGIAGVIKGVGAIVSAAGVKSAGDAVPAACVVIGIGGAETHVGVTLLLGVALQLILAGSDGVVDPGA